ncbi:hypothetical protein NKI15_06870 [Mesorhizobium sp. M0862]|uniref:hypothetical protein n=1 Tax=Mesorhizobium sp. M0862 TaxID=2957015 RepID=UPI003336A2E1
MSLIMPAYFNARDTDFYVTDFAEYPVGAPPANWSKRWATAHYDATVETSAGSFSGKALRFNITTINGLGLFSWDRVPLAADFEILTRSRMLTAPATITVISRPAGRAGGGIGTENAYSNPAFYHTSSATDWRVQTSKMVAGTSTIINGPGDGLGPLIAATAPSVWIWNRFRVQGTNVQRRGWQQGTAEPGTWDNIIVDASLPAAGWIGDYVADSLVSMRETDFFAVALKGKTAPSVRK